MSLPHRTKRPRRYGSARKFRSGPIEGSPIAEYRGQARCLPTIFTQQGACTASDGALAVVQLRASKSVATSARQLRQTHLAPNADIAFPPYRRA